MHWPQYIHILPLNTCGESHISWEPKHNPTFNTSWQSPVQITTHYSDLHIPQQIRRQLLLENWASRHIPLKFSKKWSSNRQESILMLVYICTPVNRFNPKQKQESFHTHTCFSMSWLAQRPRPIWTFPRSQYSTELTKYRPGNTLIPLFSKSSGTLHPKQ